MKISIVIPVYNRKAYTRNCLLSLQRQSVSGFSVIIVDDGSTDGTSEMIESEFPEVTVLKGSGDLFWTAATNLGIKHALEQGTDYILTLNNDTVASQDFVEKMIYWAVRKPDVLLGALDIDYNTRKPYYGGEIVNWTWSSSRFLLHELKPEEQTGLHEVSLFPGRGLFIPAKVFESVGLFEEKQLPHYLADYDFTQLARRNGFKIYCNYDARLFTFPEEGGDHKIRNKKNLRSYFNHLFSIKGGGNLRNFTVYTIRNCPPQFIPVSLLSGYARRLVGFWLR